MSPSPGRPKMGEAPLGGVARSAGVLSMSPSPGRPKMGAAPLDGVARSAGVLSR